jgi:hypothetical protein
MKESVVEAYLRDQVKQAGGRAYKFVSPGNDGVPDRLVCFPGGQAYFVELKAPGKNPRPLQVIQIKRLRDLGFSVYVIDCKESVDKLLNHLQQKIG